MFIEFEFCSLSRKCTWSVKMTKIIHIVVFCAVLIEFCDSTRNVRQSLNTLRTVLRILEGSSLFQNQVSKLRENVRDAAILGIMMGSLNAESRMEKSAEMRMKNLTENLQSSKPKVTKEIKEIELKMKRDRTSVNILMCAMEFVSKSRNFKDCMDAARNNDKLTVTTTLKPQQNKKVSQVTSEMQAKIRESYDSMRNDIVASIRETIKDVDRPKVGLAPTPIHSYGTVVNDKFLQLESPLQVYFADFDETFRFKRLNKEKKTAEEQKDKKSERQEEADEEDFDVTTVATSGGGLAGLIANLSGGEGGSDVGALVGAISGVVVNLFGPGGLDIPSLLSTGTSLLAGLLGGDENFGKVLGDYVGIAVEGFSGGGGAVSVHDLSALVS